MPELTYTETLVTTTCWCGIHLAVPDNLLEWAKDAPHRAIFCPLGHEFVFNNNNKEKLRKAEEQLERERNRLKATHELLHAEERSHAATRGHLTRTKKRVANGVCPCCHRHFVNVERHMATKHPDYVEQS